MDASAALPPGLENRVQVDNALRALQQKKPVPEIDFSLHTMEDGSQVSTMERVCKGNYKLLCPAIFRPKSA
jgi:serine/threonine-protein phosphatase 2B catalytic subunit